MIAIRWDTKIIPPSTFFPFFVAATHSVFLPPPFICAGVTTPVHGLELDLLFQMSTSLVLCCHQLLMPHILEAINIKYYQARIHLILQIR